MKYTIAVLFAIFSFSLISQSHFVGIKGTVNYTKISPSLAATNFLPSSTFGLTYEYKLNPKYSIGIEALYAAKGFRSEVREFSQVGLPIRDIDVDSKYNYISLPVKFGYVLSEESDLFIKVGLNPSFLTGSKTELSNSSETYMDVLREESISSFDLGSMLEFGFNIKTFEKAVIYTTLGFQYSINSVLKDLPKKANGPNHLGYELALGYKLAI